VHTRLYIEGLNLEKLLRTAMQKGILLKNVCRIDARSMEAAVTVWQMRRFEALCSQFGWHITVKRRGCLERCSLFVRRRKMLFAGLALCVAAVTASDKMILAIEIENARENIAEVRSFLQEEGVQPGRRKASFSLDNLRRKLALHLPGLSFAGMRYEGSTLIVDCYPAKEGEQNVVEGKENDIIASRSGIVTRIYVQSGTPVVSPGQAVRKGQVLIRGTERTKQGLEVGVQAQGKVNARVWSQGKACVSLQREQHVETGRTRRRITMCSAWHRRIVQDAEPFASQDVEMKIQRIPGLYLPVWREIEIYTETIVDRIPANRADAAAWAEGAAEEIAKNGCPHDALILDKWVDYSMIDNEFVYATVVLEYEAPIASRSAAF